MLLQIKHDKYHVETVHVCQAANNLPSIRFCQNKSPPTPLNPEFITKRKQKNDNTVRQKSVVGNDLIRIVVEIQQTYKVDTSLSRL